MEHTYKYFRALKNVIFAFLVANVIFSALHFPYDVDAPLTSEEVKATQKYYTEAYQSPAASENKEKSQYETEYLRITKDAAGIFQIENRIREFVRRFNLSDRAVLEIGSGRGYLQDVAQNYTGLDIAASVARFYHKKFVLGSATAMPFPDDSFDGVWSIWVFEHVPNPEQAFNEARRVTRDKGILFLLPAWNCTSWAAEGYEVRPYSDFDLVGKIIKASIPLRTSEPVTLMTFVPNRILRSLVSYMGPTKLRYRRLTPNYEKYWVADSDAVNSIDSHEAMLWFWSRGDECLNCEGVSILMGSMPLIIRVHKPAR
jgi:SAM-dependent methyltransferase